MARIRTLKPDLRVVDPSAYASTLLIDSERRLRYPQILLYRFFGVRAQLLYVGITGWPAERWTIHRTKSGWWHETTGLATEVYNDMRTALSAERAAIAVECPIFNKRSRARVTH